MNLIVEIKYPSGVAKNIRDVTEFEWEMIEQAMYRTFEHNPPDRGHGKTIKTIAHLEKPQFRYAYRNWRVGYTVEPSFLGKIVYIYCCEDRETFYNTLKRTGVWK